ERRQGDRRRRAAVDQELRLVGYALITIGGRRAGRGGGSGGQGGAGPGAGSPQELEKKDGGRGRPLREKGRAPPPPPPPPPPAPVQARGVVARGAEHGGGLPRLESAPFGRGEQRGPDPSAAGASMHEHLGEVAAMGLILRLSQDQLRRADDRPGRIFR